MTPRKAGAATKLTVRDPGGPYVKAYAAAYYEPFNKKFAGKIEVTGVIGKHEPTSQIKAMVDTGTYTWDVALLSEAAQNLLRDAGYLEKLENQSHPDVQEIPDRFKTEYLQGVDVYATVPRLHAMTFTPTRRGPRTRDGRICGTPAQFPGCGRFANTPSTPSRKRSSPMGCRRARSMSVLRQHGLRAGVRVPRQD